MQDTQNGTALAVPQQEWETKLDLIRQTVAVGHSPAEMELFFYQARRTGLDPLARQIYSIKRGGKATIQVGIDGYRLIADRTNLYAGNDDAVFVEGEKYPESATVRVWKIVGGQRCPFTATARWDEYYPGDQSGQMWRKMPHTMLGKCAEGLALRKAFPAELSGTYVDAEMHQAGRPDGVDGDGAYIDAEVVEQPAQAQRQRSAPMPQAAAIPPREPTEEMITSARSKWWGKYAEILQDYVVRGGDRKAPAAMLELPVSKDAMTEAANTLKAYIAEHPIVDLARVDELLDDEDTGS